MSKRYKNSVALEEVSFNVEPGRVTALLGPNGAGKSTLMRIMVGLARPDEGGVTVDGRAYVSLRRPLHVVGAHLGGRPMHPQRTARQHLLALARANGIGRRRVEEVLAISGIESVARQSAGGFSLGMGQRLGVAASLLGDPEYRILDEPVNGLDTDGVRWIRTLLRDLADQGRAVLLSSHLMSEVQLVADQVVVLGRGRLLADVPTAELAARARDEVVLVTADQGEASMRLAGALSGVEMTSFVSSPGLLELRAVGTSEQAVGQAAFELGLPVYRLTRDVADLESGYLSLVDGQASYVAATGAS